MHSNHVIGNSAILLYIYQIQNDEQQVETRQERVLEKQFHKFDLVLDWIFINNLKIMYIYCNKHL